MIRSELIARLSEENPELSSKEIEGIVLLMFLENVFPPLPSELVMPAAGFAAARGELDALLVALSARWAVCWGRCRCTPWAARWARPWP